MKEEDTAYGGCVCQLEFAEMGEGREEKGTNDGIEVLDRYCAHDVSAYFKTDAEENDEEVVRFIPEDCLIELDDHGDGIQDGKDD